MCIRKLNAVEKCFFILDFDGSLFSLFTNKIFPAKQVVTNCTHTDMTKHPTCTQTLHIHKNLCMVLISLCKNHLSYKDQYPLKKQPLPQHF